MPHSAQLPEGMPHPSATCAPTTANAPMPSVSPTQSTSFRSRPTSSSVSAAKKVASDVLTQSARYDGLVNQNTGVRPSRTCRAWQRATRADVVPEKGFKAAKESSSPLARARREWCRRPWQ
eukprot:2540298-Prymnesium_polylepis.1